MNNISRGIGLSSFGAMIITTILYPNTPMIAQPRWTWLISVAAVIGVAQMLFCAKRGKEENAVALGIVAMAGILFGLSFLLSGCATPPPPEVIVKHDLAPPAKPVVPDDPYASLPPDIVAAIKANDTKTVFRHNTVTIYPYSNEMKYVVNCQPNQAVQIRLRDDEDTDENDAVLGDSDRWSIKIGMHTVLLKPLGTNKPVAIQKTMADSQNPATFDIRPADPDMRTNLIITTNKRRYELVLRIARPFTDAVEWYYTSDVQQEYAARQSALKELAAWQPSTP